MYELTVANYAVWLSSELVLLLYSTERNIPVDNRAQQQIGGYLSGVIQPHI
jgi:hypothetical protein